MSELATLFKEPETSLGVFYPKNYVIATFPSFEAALAANKALHHAGLSESEALAVPGSDLLEYFNEIHARNGPVGGLMTELSRFIGTEAAFEDNDVKYAHRGAAFLAVHCTTEAESDRIRDLVKPFEPIAMQWYWSGAIRSLI